MLEIVFSKILEENIRVDFHNLGVGKHFLEMAIIAQTQKERKRERKREGERKKGGREGGGRKEGRKKARKEENSFHQLNYFVLQSIPSRK